MKPRVNSDKVKALTGNNKIVRISALKNIGIKELEEGIAGIVWQGHLAPREEILISNLRHIGLLREAEAAVEKTRLAFRERLSGEFISHELKEALVALDKITGGVASEDLLDKIFAEFCIGK